MIQLYLQSNKSKLLDNNSGFHCTVSLTHLFITALLLILPHWEYQNDASWDTLFKSILWLYCFKIMTNFLNPQTTTQYVYFLRNFSIINLLA